MWLATPLPLVAFECFSELLDLGSMFSFVCVVVPRPDDAPIAMPSARAPQLLPLWYEYLEAWFPFPGAT